VELVSTGGTQRILEEAGIKVIAIREITGSGSVMDGRVKTLHPKIFGGILSDRKKQSHLTDLQNLGGLEIDMVVVNFYPFIKEAVTKKLDFKDAIEFIDIGGPSMVRAAAKNYHSVLPLCEPAQYLDFINIFNENNGNIPLQFLKKSAASVFSITAAYESAISNYFNKYEIKESVLINLNKAADLRYGENPHQEAAFYLNQGLSPSWHQHQGKILSYNNYADMESAFEITMEFPEEACAIIKHSNPCGFGIGKNIKDAYLRAVSTDPVSYFGGIVGFNREVESDTAEELIQPFLECIIAPSFSDKALDILKGKKNLRVVSVSKEGLRDQYSIKSVAGGYLYQKKDNQQGELEKLKIMTRREPTASELIALHLGWKLVRHVKSNAIIFANGQQILGVGAGQMSRIDSVKIAVQKVLETDLNLRGAIMASDAFFPFSDSIEIAAEAGISAIIQPGGSIKDGDVIKKTDELGLAMVFTGIRHFLH
jgi:phosphoribosylaminoimidazolecarboxamide formyltransferase/IMP cyclohydrolase